MLIIYAEALCPNQWFTVQPSCYESLGDTPNHSIVSCQRIDHLNTTYPSDLVVLHHIDKM